MDALSLATAMLLLLACLYGVVAAWRRGGSVLRRAALTALQLLATAIVEEGHLGWFSGAPHAGERAPEAWGLRTRSGAQTRRLG